VDRGKLKKKQQKQQKERSDMIWRYLHEKVFGADVPNASLFVTAGTHQQISIGTKSNGIDLNIGGMIQHKLSLAFHPHRNGPYTKKIKKTKK
jgi:hypothetical protein